MFSYIAGSPFVLETVNGVSPQVFGLVVATNALVIVDTSQISRRLVVRRVYEKMSNPIVLDRFAVLALLEGKPPAQRVADILRAGYPPSPVW